ncbi:hypothetical protein Hypma_001947 [Hypsizygus marmoreus]|uniref:Uncharacterized protein n=1 Tax=Hypsizygus marmoreus TaxID=39966 RepID=A0A369J9F1_HYPMA|nr:hypothetical protein Hypma_001947 [Hypsizygus marmoreus]
MPESSSILPLSSSTSFPESSSPWPKITWYRILVLISIVGFLSPKAALSNANEGVAATLEWVFGIPWTILMTFLAWCESRPPPSLRWLLDTDWSWRLRLLASLRKMIVPLTSLCELNSVLTFVALAFVAAIGVAIVVLLVRKSNRHAIPPTEWATSSDAHSVSLLNTSPPPVLTRRPKTPTESTLLPPPPSLQLSTSSEIALSTTEDTRTTSQPTTLSHTLGTIAAPPPETPAKPPSLTTSSYPSLTEPPGDISVLIGLDPTVPAVHTGVEFDGSIQNQKQMVHDVPIIWEISLIYLALRMYNRSFRNRLPGRAGKQKRIRCRSMRIRRRASLAFKAAFSFASVLSFESFLCFGIGAWYYVIDEP